MIRTIVFALFGLALASAAQAMPFSPAHQPDGMITSPYGLWRGQGNG